MPDLSSAPADIQAIWKKVRSGGIPTPAEAQKLGQYLAAHSGDIQRAAVSHADSVRVAAPKQAEIALGAAADPDKACPAATTPPALRDLSPAAAQAFLDSMSHMFLAREKPSAAKRLEAGLARVKDANRLETTGAMFYLAGFDGAAIVVEAAAARAGGAGSQRRWTNLGAALVSYGDPADAVVALHHAMRMAPPYPLLIHELGVAFADLGQLAVAESLLARATASAPTFGLAWDALARVQSCRGNMTAAWRSLAQAQDVDWNDRRDRILQKHDPESNDDAIESQKPFPEPAGTPYASSSSVAPANFAGETPVLADTWRENLGHPVQFLKTANAYRLLASQILKQGQDAEVAEGRARDAAEHAPTRASHGSYLLSVSIQNGGQALKAVERLRTRLSAREALLLRDHADHDSVITQQLLADQRLRESTYAKCLENATTDVQRTACRVPYCRSEVQAADKYYPLFRDNARVYFGGVTGLAARYDKVMRQWFMWAGDPGAQIDIDAERRYQLAGMLVTAFTVAAGVGPNDVPSDDCFDPQKVAELEALAAKDAEKGNPGPCTAFDKSIPFVVSIQGDCKSLRMTLDLDLDLPATPTLEYRAAEHGHAGRIFVGGGQDALHGLVSGEAGLAVTFNEGGWVQGFGPAASATIGNDLVATGTAAGMLNLLDHGPAGDASVGFNGFGYQASLATDTGFSGHFD